MSSFDAIIFDFDGVIADSEIVSARGLAAGLTAAGLPTSTHESVDRYTGLHREDVLRAIHAHWGDMVPADITARLDDGCADHFGAGVDPVTGVAAFLDQTAHVPRAIASSSSSVYLHGHLAGFGFAHHFDVHVYSGREHVTRGKPHPDIYLHAAAALGVNPARTLIIEDSPVGARGAVASGGRVIGFGGAAHITDSLRARVAAEGVEAQFDDYGALARYLSLPAARAA